MAGRGPNSISKRGGKSSAVSAAPPASASGSELASSAPNSKRRSRGSRSSGRGRGPRWVPVQTNSVDRNNEETFGAADWNSGEQWSQQKSLVDAFEQFKRQQLLTTHKAGVKELDVVTSDDRETSELPREPAAPAASGVFGGTPDLLQQILETTDIFGWNSTSSQGQEPPLCASASEGSVGAPSSRVRWATTNPPSPGGGAEWSLDRSSSFPTTTLASSVPAAAADDIPPLTKQHIQALIESPTVPVFWPQPNTSGLEAKVPWMSQTELESVLRLTLLQMEKANQVLSRPQTLRLDSEMSSTGHITNQSSPDRGFLWQTAEPDHARRSLLCECVLARHLEKDLFHPGPCPLLGSELCLSECVYLEGMYVVEEGFQAVLQYQYYMMSQGPLDNETAEEAEFALNAALKICLDSETPPASIDRTCRRLMMLTEHPKGLRLVSQVWSLLLTSPLAPTDMGGSIWLLTACLRNFRLVSAVCAAASASREFAFFVPLLRHAIDYRSVISVSGSDSLACLVKDCAWEHLQVASTPAENYFFIRNGFDGDIIDPALSELHREAVYLRRMWFCMVHTLARLIEEQRFALSNYLLRNFVLGYFQYLAGFPASRTLLQVSMYVPTAEAVAVLSNPALSLVFTLMLLLIQDTDNSDTMSASFGNSCAYAAQMLDSYPLESVAYKFDDTYVATSRFPLRKKIF
eukprot:Gregarina_sp_Poly_1__2229@NODE_1597_length_3747_cov_464_154891_g1052_i0_p1_GENE_NODE_1597_length_3747_cov_464_154891_g1052_i0NODE_1597_length_3747_cov_464_154891_g1052_i0_p1_ORF_typecomplete_len691_score94_84_NODE_1597_length_3747_cov_464_154891_g1052_i02962368